MGLVGYRFFRRRYAARADPPTKNPMAMGQISIVLPSGLLASTSSSPAVGVGVRWGAAVEDAVGVKLEVAGVGVDVSVAGGVTCKSSRWSGCRTEESFSPFHAINSPMVTWYRFAIHKSDSPN